jgi:hypothetical protein
MRLSTCCERGVPGPDFAETQNATAYLPSLPRLLTTITRHLLLFALFFFFLSGFIRVFHFREQLSRDFILS